MLSTSIIHELPSPRKAEYLNLILNSWFQENRQAVILPGIMMFYVKQQNAIWIFLTLHCTNLNIA